MGRSFLMTLLALDLLVMGGAGFIIWDRISKKNLSQASGATTTAAPPVEAPIKIPIQFEPAASSTPTAAPSTAPAIATIVKEEKIGPPRKISFRYSDIAAKRVSIVGDFNQWSPKLLRKDAYGNWSLTLMIAPGEYTYNFIVDGKMIRDPNNKRVKQSSQKIPSSLLSVADNKKR